MYLCVSIYQASFREPHEVSKEDSKLHKRDRVDHGFILRTRKPPEWGIVLLTDPKEGGSAKDRHPGLELRSA